jgi:hypothetical protein
MSNLPSTKPMIQHYIIGNTRGTLDRLNTLCGFEVRALPVPPQDAPQCAECQARLSMVDRAEAYARGRKITPEAAARALNFPNAVALECRSRVTR